MSKMTSSTATAAAAVANANRAAGSKILTDFSIKTIIEGQPDKTDKPSTTARNPKEKTRHRPTIDDQRPPPPPPVDHQQANKIISIKARETPESPPPQTATSRKYRPKNFRCPACKMAFSNNGQLKNHVRIHTGERPFSCNQQHCNKTFTRNEELTRHKLIHTGVRPHSCTACGKRFGRKDHLKKHARTHDRKRLRKKVFVPARAYMEHDIDMFVPPKPARIMDNNDDDHISDRPHQDGASNARLINSESPSSSINANNSSALTATHHHLPLTMPPTATSVVPPLTPGLSIDHLLHCRPHHQLYHHAIASTLTTASTVTTTTTTTNAPNSSAIQQLASDYWNKWYNLLGFYQHQHYQPIDRLSGLFRK